MNPPPDQRFKADLLLVVAHPDDETEIGAYLARAVLDEKKRVAVVFGTRGNGGGNAEGQEQAAALGAVREIEARTAVGHFGITHVWFLNGLDTPSQDVLNSLETWDHGDSLGRLVRIFRLTRPSVVVTWLPDYVAGENHGDHQAAGVLATEAFDLAGNATAFAEQIAAPRNRSGIANLTEGLHPWQAQKLFYITDASHTEFLKNQGPEYSAKETSPARGVSYARLAAEECAYHLTQDDTGQMARDALAKNDLHFFEEPVRFIFGKSLVRAATTGELFEGVATEGIAYQAPPAFVPPHSSAPSLELSGSWRFYRAFWQAHGIDHLGDLLKEPELLVNYESFVTIPYTVTNPTDEPLDVKLTVKIPQGWTLIRLPVGEFRVDPHGTADTSFQAKTPVSKTEGWHTITISAEANGKQLESKEIRVQVDRSAMPQ